MCRRARHVGGRREWWEEKVDETKSRGGEGWQERKWREMVGRWRGGTGPKWEEGPWFGEKREDTEIVGGYKPH